MKFYDERIQKHLLSGGNIKKIHECRHLEYREGKFIDNMLCFADKPNEYYRLDKNDLTSDDWEIVKPEYDWEKIIKDKNLCQFWDELDETDATCVGDFGNRIFGKVIEQEGDNLICEFDSANYDFKQENVIRQLKDKLNIAIDALKQIGEIDNNWLPLEKLDNLDLHPVKEFIQEVECGGFIDYDGWGMPVIETLSGKFLYKNETIYPSEVLEGKKLDCDYVAWFNR